MHSVQALCEVWKPGEEEYEKKGEAADYEENGANEGYTRDV